MHTWNYRVTRATNSHDEQSFEISEVYYDREGYISGWANADPPSGDSWLECEEDFKAMALAFERPVVDVSDPDSPWEVPLTGSVPKANLEEELKNIRRERSVWKAEALTLSERFDIASKANDEYRATIKELEKKLEQYGVES